MNQKKEKIFDLLVYDEETSLWEVKKQNLWYHEAMTLEEHYALKNFSTRVIDNNKVEEFLKSANGVKN